MSFLKSLSYLLVLIALITPVVGYIYLKSSYGDVVLILLSFLFFSLPLFVLFLITIGKITEEETRRNKKLIHVALIDISLYTLLSFLIGALSNYLFNLSVFWSTYIVALALILVIWGGKRKTLLFRNIYYRS
ncbi:MAG: hypothetical protein ACOC5L_02830 [Halobacteriota archaeon]